MSNDGGKKKALAAAGTAVGLVGSGARSSGRTTPGDSVDQQGDGQMRPASTALVFVDDYQPGVGFQPVSWIQQPTVNQILGYVDPANPEAGDGAVVDPTDWNGYVVRYTGCGPGNYRLVFLREGTLQQGQTYSFTTDAVFFDNGLGLLEARIRTGTGQTGAEGEGQEDTETEGEAGAEEGGTETEQAEGTATTTEETTTTTETTTTETPEETTTTTPDGTTTTPNGTTTTTDDGTTTTAEVVVNATETEDE